MKKQNEGVVTKNSNKQDLRTLFDSFSDLRFLAESRTYGTKYQLMIITLLLGPLSGS